MTVKLTVKDIAVFGMLGAMMYLSKLVMEWLPNVHLIGVFIIASTVVYRAKALYPLYIFVLLCGLFGGFSLWWIPYLYVWTALWGVTMLLPKTIGAKWRPLVYMCLCAAHGFCFGILYAPAQALLFGFDFEQTVAWVIAGLPFDLTHGIGNFVAGILIVPLIALLKRIERTSHI